MPSLPKGQRHPVELRERATRMVLEHQHEYPSQWKAIGSIAEKLDINREALRLWVRRAETDAGQRPGLSTDERAKMRQLEDVEFATMAHVDWFNNRRLHGAITDGPGYTTPAAHEANYYRQTSPAPEPATQ